MAGGFRRRREAPPAPWRQPRRLAMHKGVAGSTSLSITHLWLREKLAIARRTVRQARRSPHRCPWQWPAPGNWRRRRPGRAGRRTGSSSGTFPVASAKTMSPSSGVNTGKIARAMPAAAITASRWHCACVRAASVATTQRVVLAPGSAYFSKGCAASAGQGCGRPEPPNSLPLQKARPRNAVYRHRNRANGVDGGQGAHGYARAFLARQADSLSEALPSPPRIPMPGPAATVAPKPAPAEPRRIPVLPTPRPYSSCRDKARGGPNLFLRR